MISGLLLTMARKMMPNVVCICVLRYRWFSTISAMASRLSSMTTRMPSRSDSSRRSEMPSMRLSRTSSAIFSSRRALFVMYGTSVTTICCFSLFFCVSMTARARTWMMPRPVA